MILGQAIATLETSNPEAAQERKTALTNKYETHPLNRQAGLWIWIIYLTLQTLIGPEWWAM